MKMRGQKRTKGFTFIEIMFVVVIIGILLALVGPRLAGRASGAKEAAAKAQIKNIETSLKAYEINMGKFPKTLEEITLDPDDVDDQAYDGPYMDSVPADPWGNPYKYEAPGKNNRRDFDLWSMGIDGQDGTEDDLVNWKKKE